MAAISKNAIRQFVDSFGLAHTSNFDVRIADLPEPFNTLMPCIAATFDRATLADVEQVPGLPAAVTEDFTNRMVNMTVYDTAERKLESSLREWFKSASSGLNRAKPIHLQARQVDLIEQYVPVGSRGIDNSLFSEAGLRNSVTAIIDRATRGAEDQARLRLAQEAAELQAKFHTGWINATIDDVFQIPSIRSQLFQATLDAQVFTPIKRLNTYMCIPTGNIQTNADLTGRGGLSQIQISLKIVGELPRAQGFSESPEGL